MTTIFYTSPSSEGRAVQAIRTIITAIGSFFVGMYEGFVAYRQFEEQKSWRVRHDTALRETVEHNNRRASSTGI